METTETSASPSVTADVQWTAHTILFATLTVLGVALGFVLLYRFYMVVFLFFVATALKVALDPAVNWLTRHKVGKATSVIAIYLLLLAALGGLLWLLVPTLAEQARTVLAQLPEYYEAARAAVVNSPIGLIRGLGRLLPLTFSLPVFADYMNGDSATAEASPWVTVSLGLRSAGAVLAVFVLAFYWTREGELIQRKFMLPMTSARRDEMRALIGEIEGKIGGYFRGQLILCAIVGVLSLVAFLLIGVPNAVLLGLLMGLFEAIPVLGPTLGAIPALLMTLAATPDKTLWVLLALVTIQVAENNLLVPRVMDESVGVNAVVSMLAIAAFGVLFGIAGALLAIPLAAIVQILLNRLLFNTSTLEDTTVGLPPASDLGRSQVDVWRLEARTLAQAVRKQARANDDDPNIDSEADLAFDEIEALANELDQLLAPKEQPA